MDEKEYGWKDLEYNNLEQNKNGFGSDADYRYKSIWKPLKDMVELVEWEMNQYAEFRKLENGKFKYYIQPIWGTGTKGKIMKMLGCKSLNKDYLLKKFY